MSEFVNTDKSNANTHRQLLATASALTLFGYGYGLTEVKAAEGDSDRPTVWIELGGQLERVDTHQEQFVPPFIVATPRPGAETVSPLSVDHSPRYSLGGEAKLTFEPDGSDWVFAAAVRYGRSKNHSNLHQQTYPTQPIVNGAFQRAIQFSDTDARHDESHTILDFQVGKDFGIGLFGSGSASSLNVGVRFAQFEARSSVAFATDPDAHPDFKYFAGQKFLQGSTYHFNSAKAASERSFHGVGPAVSWSNSVAALGGSESGEISFDWGANAALLFGRQKALSQHQATAQYHNGGFTAYFHRTVLYQHRTDVPLRSRSVIVPNIGGFAGLSARYASAKLSLGYRADFFVGAMDGGVNTRKTESIGFFGPFASIGIGLGG